MKLAKMVLSGAAVLVLASTTVLADDPPEFKPAPDPGPQLRLEVVMTRSEGDTVIARLPYTLLLSADGGNARLHGGIQLPILVRHEGSNTMMFKDAGGSVNARAWALEEGRFKVDLRTTYGGVYPTNGESETDEPDVAPAAPVLRDFSTSATITLRDGQSAVFSDNADPITGETVKTEVTLHVVE